MTILASSAEAASSGLILASGFDGGFAMTLASGIGARLTYELESVRGVLNGTPNMSVLRTTGRNINLQKNTLRSNETKSNRHPQLLRHGFNRVVGSPGFELSQTAYDDFIEAALGGTWTAPPAALTGETLTITVTATANLISGISSTLTLRPGMVITLAGFSNSANNGDCMIVSITSTLILVAKLTGDTNVFAGEGPTAACSITPKGDYVDVGSTLRTFTIERGFTDISDFQLFKGCAVNQMSLAASPEQIIGGNFDIIGMSDSAPTIVSRDTTPNAAPTFEPYASFEGTVAVFGTKTAVATNISMQINNNRTLQAVFGSKFSPDVFDGTCNITGEATVFLEDMAHYEKFRDETVGALALYMEGIGGDFMTIGLGAIKYTTFECDPPQNGPVPARVAFEAGDSSDSSNFFCTMTRSTESA